MSALDETRIEMVSDAPTYRPDGAESFFRDLMRAEREGDPSARDRLERHAAEQRANPTSNTSTLAPPVWVVEEAATAPRPHRVLADAVQRFPLPPGHTINVPRVVTGTTAQPEQDGAAVSDTDLTDAAVSSTVTTIVGVADVSQQLVDNGGPHADALIWQDLTASYDAQLELQMLNGSGSGQNLLGILNNIPATNQVAFTSGSPTGPTLMAAIGKAMAVVGDSRGLHPELWLMRTARWSWLTSSEDTAGQPLQITDWGTAGQGLLALRVAFDNAIPATLSSNQDAILCCRPSDIILFESELKTVATPEPLSGDLQVRFSLRGSAAMINRYPSGHSSITGTGLVVQSGF